MNTIKSIFKLLSFIVGVCTYGTVCLVCLVLYRIMRTMVFESYPNISNPNLVDVILFIGTMGLISMIFGKIRQHFVDEPTIKLKITKTKTETI